MADLLEAIQSSEYSYILNAGHSDTLGVRSNKTKRKKTERQKDRKTERQKDRGITQTTQTHRFKKTLWCHIVLLFTQPSGYKLFVILI